VLSQALAETYCNFFIFKYIRKRKMKKCPNCQKTFDDNMKFCQVDGTSLVSVADNQPQTDPYATMVADKSDLPIPPKEPQQKEEPAQPEPAEEPDPYKTIVAGTGSSTVGGAEENKSPADESDEGDLLEIPGNEDDEGIDPLKTMVVSGNTADNIRFNIPDEKPKPKESQPKQDAADDAMSPEIPKFSEPEISPPGMTDEAPAAEKKETPPKPEPPRPSPPVNTSPTPTPFESEKPKTEAQPPKPEIPKQTKQTPIPSPFDDSMPPGYAPPSTPPFEAKNEPMHPKPLNEPKNNEPVKSPFADPQEPIKESNTEGWGTPSSPMMSSGSQDSEPANQFDSPIVSDAGETADGQNSTNAFVALGLGVASLLCGFGPLLGIPAIFFGMKARRNAAENPREYGGATPALIGIILGALGTILIGLAVIAWIVLFFVIGGSSF
jgi:hypothetical protein